MNREKFRILAVDDIYDNLVILKALIGEAFPNAEVLLTQSGKKVQALAEEYSPDIILLDIVMPQMDGFQVCKMLKANPALKDVPVVFITALKTNRESRIKALEAGAEGFLSKPLDEVELVAQMLAMLKIRKANFEKKEEQYRLRHLVETQTMQLRETHLATLNLLEDLQQENEKRKQTEEALRVSNRHFEFLAQTAFELVGFDNMPDIYVFAAKKIHELLDRKSIVAIVDYDNSANRWKMQHLEGISNRSTEVSKLFGIDLMKLEGDISTTYYDKILTCKLEELDFDLPGLLNNRFSAAVGNAVKKLLSIEKLMCIGVQQDEHIAANITFTVHRHTPELNTSIIEAFALQISNFIKRLKSEEALRESEEKYRRITDNITDVVWTTDLNLKTTYVSRSINNLVGVSVDEYMKSGVEKRHPPETIAKFSELLAKELENEKDATIDKNRTVLLEGEHYKADGSLISISMHVSFLRDDAGNPIGLQGLTRDISERKQAENALKLSEEKYRMISESMADFTFSYIKWDDDYIIDWLAGAVEAITGFSIEHIFEKNSWRFMVHPEDDDVYETSILKLQPGENSVCELRIIDNTGKTKWLSVSTVCKLDEEIGKTMIYGGCMDITARKEAEDELMKYEWITEKQLSSDNKPGNRGMQHYDDVTKLNTSRLILDGVGFENLKAMSEDVMILLDTSLAVYEANGDYAYGTFESSWCKFMDESSYLLCGTSDVGKALCSGKWLCHENCWHDSAKAAIESGFATDIECVGGIRLYAVPVKAAGEVIGVVSIGYGNPPQDHDSLKTLSGKYNVRFDELLKRAKSYLPRPDFIVELGKKRCQYMAQLIGEIIERKQLHEALKQNEAFTRLVLDSLPVGIAVNTTEPQVSFSYMNEEYTRLYRTSSEDLIKPGSFWEKVYEDADFREEIKTRVIEDCASGDLDRMKWENIPIQRKDEETTYISARNVPIPDSNLMISAVIDVTDRKKAEDRIRESEEKYRLLIEQMHEGLLLVDNDDVIQFANPMFCTMLGYESHELTGRVAYTFLINDTDRDLIVKKNSDREQGISERYEINMIRKSGEQIAVQMNASPVYDGQGKVIGSMSTCFDITQRKKAEVIQKAGYEIARSVYHIQSIEDMLDFIRLSISTVLDTTNFMVADYNQDNDTLRQLIYKDEEDKFDEWAAGSSLSGYVVTTGESLLLDRQGIEEFKLSHNLELIGTPSACWLGVPIIIKNEVFGAIVVQSYTNNHAYDAFDKALLELIAHEIGLFIERQNMLNDLIDAKNKAEESDRLKSAFINNISHEIRTPLTGIIGFGQMILDPDLDQVQKAECFDVVQRSTNRLIGTISDIMDISMIKAGSIRPKISDVLLNVFIQNLYGRMQRLCNQKNVVVSYDCPPESEGLVVSTDKELLEKILWQLLSNAEKFTSEGRISLGYSRSAKNVEFYVKDSGRGIEAEYLDRVFDAFWQEDVSSTRGHEGSGLGLSIAKGFAEILGGSISIESEKEKGTTVRLSLSYSPVVTSTTFDSPGFPLSNRDGLILIAEDDEVNQLYLKTVLKKSGYKTLSAYDGSQAVEMCRQYPEIDMVLMDIKMPVLNGMEATAQIKAIRSDIIIVAVTAHAQTGDEHRILEAGCDAYLAKPFSIETLTSLCKKMLNRS